MSPPTLRSTLGLVATASLVAAGPCDIYASGNTPCVAAHATTRALYNSFNGGLYQVQRGSDGSKTDIKPLSPGGVANAAAQDSFCASTTCTITTIYDQSGNGNHLTPAPPGGAQQGPGPGGFDNPASATGAPVTLNGKKAYGVFIPPKTGYRNNKAKGTATGDQPQGMYAIFDGTHYNGGCCFDYGNAETNSLDTGSGHMEAIYFGTCTVWGRGAGNGPWIMADLENGLFSGANVKLNAGDPTISNRFTTAVVKGKQGQWAIRGGDAASGGLSSFYNGPRPSASGYNPMKKEGAIILGIGGDNSNGAQGTFYEGVMTSGYPSDATEDAVQQNILAAKYATGSSKKRSLNQFLTAGSTVTIRATNNRYLSHNGATVNTEVVSSSSDSSAQKAATWIVREGLGRSECLSFESADKPGSFISHQEDDYVLRLQANDGSKQFAEDATYCPETGLSGNGVSLRSWNYATRYIRRFEDGSYVSSNGGPENFDDASSFNDDVTFVISAGFA